jgi:cytochrome c oxidase subunit II
MVLIGVVVGAIVTAIALVVDWLPAQASEEAERIDFVFWLTTWICVAIFAVVAAMILYSVVRFRASDDDDSDGLPIHGHTGIEVVWTAIPLVLVTVIAVASGVALARNDNTTPNPLTVQVTAQQFSWLFTYPNGTTSATLRLPLDRSARLELRALDVIHSFWVPEFRQKQDAVPGIVTRVVVTPTRVGTFPVICMELCGLGHAKMRTNAEVMPQAEFDAWLREGAEQRQDGDGAGAAVFEENGCGGCHAFGPAGSTATTGPALDDLEVRADTLGQDPEEFVRESIVEPNAVVHPDYQPNVMPQTYSQIPDDQLDALVQFLLEGEGEGEENGSS